MQSSDIRIRPATPEDAEQIVAFNLAMARETEERELDPDVLARGVASVFEDSALGRYLVAERAGRVVGSLMLTTEWSDWRDGMFWWIQSVYVESDSRRRGVYRALHQEVLDLARAAGGVCGVRLYVERENEVARQVYRERGMETTSYRLYEDDFARPEGQSSSS